MTKRSPVPHVPRTDAPTREIERDAVEVQVQSRHYVRWKQVLVVGLALALSLVASFLLLNANPRFAFVGVTVLLICVGIVIAPQNGFWLYYIVAFVRPQDLVWGLSELRISLAMAGVALTAWVVHTVIHRRPWILPLAQSYLLLGLAAVILASAAVHGGDWDRAIEVIKVIIVALGLGSYVDRRPWLLAALRVIAFSVAWLALWGLHQHFVVGLPEIKGPGVEGIAALADRNAYAMFLVMGLPLFYGFAKTARHWIFRFAWLGMIPATMYAILLTSSRGGLLGIAGVMAATFWNTRYRIPATALGMVGLALFYTVAAPDSLKGRADTIVNYEGEESAMGRILSWQAGTAMALHNPVLGVGPGNYVRSYHAYHSSTARQAHNTWVQAGAEYGLLGLALLVWLVARMMIDLRRIRARLPDSDPMREWAQMISLSLVGYLICGFFLSMEGFEPLYFYVALTMIMRRLAQEDGRQNV